MGVCCKIQIEHTGAVMLAWCAAPVLSLAWPQPHQEALSNQKPELLLQLAVHAQVMAPAPLQ